MRGTAGARQIVDQGDKLQPMDAPWEGCNKEYDRLAYWTGIASGKVGAVVSCSLDLYSPPTRALLSISRASLITM